MHPDLSVTFHSRVRHVCKSTETCFDDKGKLIEVILSAEEYMNYLHTLGDDADWLSLPAELQDAVDKLLIDAVRSEKETAISLEAMLADEA